MKQLTLLRLAGAAATAGGTARVLAALPWTQSRVVLEAIYTAIDILLLFGVMGIYLARAEALGGLGLVAFALAVTALSFIGGPDADVFGFSTYQQGAAVLAIAMAVLGAVAIVRRAMPIWGPLLWIASLAAGIAAGFLPAGAAGLAFAAAGALFGAGFVAAGLDLTLRRPSG